MVRAEEVAKYSDCYTRSYYRLSGQRKDKALKNLRSIGGTYLDVGCGRRELVDKALELGIEAKGCEIVPYLCDGQTVIEGGLDKLPFPDRSFDYVSCYDVVEHLYEEDVDRAVSELMRVTNKAFFVTTNDSRCVLDGMELHLTRKPLEWWTEKFSKDGWRVEGGRYCASKNDWHWRIERSSSTTRAK